MPRLVFPDRVPATPEKILERCKRYNIDPSKLHELSDGWYSMIAFDKPRRVRKVPVWRYAVQPEKGRFPYPPGVETFSPEYYRLMNERKWARQRSIRTGVPLFIEGYHDLETYVPKLSTKRHVRTRP